jgi:hypothetical protein
MILLLITVLKIKARKYLLAPLLMFSTVFFMSGQTSVPSEYQVKAVFLFNFAQFVEWPPSAFPSDQAPIIIGILGDNPFGSYVDNIVANEKINGHPLIVNHYKNVDEVKNCHILFINKSENDLNTIFSSLKGKNILTVSDSPDCLKQGGMIRFVTKNNKISIQINLDNAQANNLVISSKLLRLAEIVSAD